MEHNKIRLPLEVELGQELYKLIQGETIESIINEAEVEKIESNWKFILEGHSFKIGPELAPKLFSICKEVQEKLQFEEPIDFYITNSPELNAFALSRSHEKTSHLVNLNSGLVEKLNNDELKFVIGHELGHLISGNARISMLLQFVYPRVEKTPLILQHKVSLWNKLSELTADRFGFIACPDIGRVLSNFFKLSSGLDPERIHFNPAAYSKKNRETLEYFKTHAAGNMTSHPINPIRIRAVELFGESELFKKMENNEPLETDSQLNTNIEELTTIIKTLSSSELDKHRKNFIASAGIILANLDNTIDTLEYENIIHLLSRYSIFPEKYLKEIIDGDVYEIFNSSVKKIMEINPGERYNLIDFVIKLALTDHHILKEELDFIYSFGKNLGMQKKEVAQLIAAAIQEVFIPDFFTG